MNVYTFHKPKIFYQIWHICKDYFVSLYLPGVDWSKRFADGDRRIRCSSGSKNKKSKSGVRPRLVDGVSFVTCSFLRFDLFDVSDVERSKFNVIVLICWRSVSNERYNGDLRAAIGVLGADFAWNFLIFNGNDDDVWYCWSGTFKLSNVLTRGRFLARSKKSSISGVCSLDFDFVGVTVPLPLVTDNATFCFLRDGRFGVLLFFESSEREKNHCRMYLTQSKIYHFIQ